MVLLGAFEWFLKKKSFPESYFPHIFSYTSVYLVYTVINVHLKIESKIVKQMKVLVTLFNVQLFCVLEPF